MEFLIFKFYKVETDGDTVINNPDKTCANCGKTIPDKGFYIEVRQNSDTYLIFDCLTCAENYSASKIFPEFSFRGQVFNHDQAKKVFENLLGTLKPELNYYQKESYNSMDLKFSRGDICQFIFDHWLIHWQNSAVRLSNTASQYKTDSCIVCGEIFNSEVLRINNLPL